MRFLQGFVVAAALLLVSASVLAPISASEAIDFVETENNFLKKNEQLETPQVLIVHEAKKYWLIPLLSGDSVATFFPVAYADKSLSANGAINNQLFSTAKFLRDYLQYRNKLAQQSKPWFIGSDNQLIIGKLSSDLQSEVFELNIIKSEISSASTQTLISQMQTALAQMAGTSNNLSQKISVAISAEGAFTNNPDTKDLESIRDTFSDAFSLLYDLEEHARAYDDSVLLLKSKIASDASLSSDKKTQFVALASAPPALTTIGSNSIGNWVILSQETQQSIEKLVNDSKSKLFLDAAELELQKRIKRNDAYSAIFSTDPNFAKKTGFPSLKLAMDDLQSSEKKTLWTNQGQLIVAIEQYNTAVRLLNAEEYDLSIVASQKAKRAAELVKKDGFVQQQSESLDATMIVNFAVILVLLIALLYFLKNRQQIVGAVFSQESPSEDPSYAWHRK